MKKRNRFKGAVTRILLAFLQNFAKNMINVPSLTQRNAPGTPRGRYQVNFRPFCTDRTVNVFVRLFFVCFFVCLLVCFLRSGRRFILFVFVVFTLVLRQSIEIPLQSISFIFHFVFFLLLLTQSYIEETKEQAHNLQ